MQLGLIVDEFEETFVSLAEYLDTGEPVDWEPNPELGTLLVASDQFSSGGNDIWGDIGRLSEQFHHAADRLENGEFALVRAAYDDQPRPPFLLIEPGDVARLSCFVIPASSIYVIYPSPRLDYRTETLYAYVADHRDELLTGQPGTDHVRFREIPCHQEQVIEDLRAQASLGEQLYQRLGHPFSW